MQANFKLNKAKFTRAVKMLAALPKSKEARKVMTMATGQVVRKVVSITPPSKGETNKESQTRGEATILGDISKLAVPTVVDGATKKQMREVLIGMDQLLAVYKASRKNSSGRVNPRSRKEKLHVSQSDFNKLLRMQQKLVGHLAAGWNAAAEQLGIRLPAWIRRHGTRYGAIKITATATGIRVYLANKVGFVDNIPDLRRRLQWALDTVATNIIDKQIPAIVNRLGRKAGFRVK